MKYNSIFIMVLAIGLCVTLVFAENIQPVYAILFTYFSTGYDADRSIARIGDFIWVGGQDGVNAAVTKMTLTGTVVTNIPYTASVEQFYAIAPNSGNSRLYGWAGTGVTAGNLVEFDIVNNAILRTVVTGCDEGSGLYFDTPNNFLYCATATDTIRKFSLNTMALISTSTTVNAGATPCVDTDSLTYDAGIDTAFLTCNTPTRTVAIEAPFTSGTPDFATTAAVNPTNLAYNPDQDNLLIGADGTNPMVLVNYTAGVGFSAAWGSYTTNSFAEQSTQNIMYDSESNRYFAFDSGGGAGSGLLHIIDATTGDVLFASTADGANAGTEGGIFIYSNLLMYGVLRGTTTPTHDYFEFDMTGIDLGSDGTPEDVPSTGVDCTLPENANILICRLGGDGSLVGAGNFVVGNVNGTTGLTPIICATGIVDCVANPDMKTNGVGYLLVTIALGIIIGVLWVASRGDLNSIPTFIWFIATLAVVGAFTLMDLIDATFLVITAIIVVALAAAKVRGLFGGEFR